jgi:hypothetical protein
VDRELSTWLISALTDPEEGVRKVAAVAYMHMNVPEWVYLLDDAVASETNHLAGLINCASTETEKKPNVRTNAIKAIGSMCAKVLVQGGGLSEAQTKGENTRGALLALHFSCATSTPFLF